MGAGACQGNLGRKMRVYGNMSFMIFMILGEGLWMSSGYNH